MPFMLWGWSFFAWFIWMEKFVQNNLIMELTKGNTETALFETTLKKVKCFTRKTETFQLKY